jgi:hypothetical protein
MYYDWIGIKSQSITGVIRPMLIIDGTINKNDFKFEVFVDKKIMLSEITLNGGDFHIKCNISRKNKLIETYVIVNGEKYLISKLRNTLRPRIKSSIKNKICKINNKTIYKKNIDESKINKLMNEFARMEQKLDSLNEKLDKNNRISNENLYATIFHDTIKNSKWLNISLSLSSGAIGYPFAYILYRTLDEIKPKKILETGMGQSTKIITEYVRSHENVIHDIVEHDENWIEFFKNNTDMCRFQNVHILKNYKKRYNNTELNAYKNFKEEFKGKKFDLISIDGPVGVGQDYSRMDILDILPQCLEKKFIILMDDCERVGEQRTINLLEAKLKSNGIKYCSGYQYWGITSVYICVSDDLEFLCHI